jgi:hypothetical protein
MDKAYFFADIAQYQAEAFDFALEGIDPGYAYAASEQDACGARVDALFDGGSITIDERCAAGGMIVKLAYDNGHRQSKEFIKQAHELLLEQGAVQLYSERPQ